MSGLIDDQGCPKVGTHRELERAEINKSKDVVHRTIFAIRNVTNPFSLVDKDHLYSLASATPVSLEVDLDVLRAGEVFFSSKCNFIYRTNTNTTYNTNIILTFTFT